MAGALSASPVERRVRTMTNEEEYEWLVKLAAELRELIFDDATDMMQGAMVGSPVECLAFAKWWIQRAKGIEPDEHNYFRSSNAIVSGAEPQAERPTRRES